MAAGRTRAQRTRAPIECGATAPQPSPLTGRHSRCMLAAAIRGARHRWWALVSRAGRRHVQMQMQAVTEPTSATSVLTPMGPGALSALSALRSEKKELRAQIRAALREVSADDIAQQSRSVTDQLMALPEFRNARRVGIYVSMRKEVDTGPVFEAIFEPGSRKSCYVPFVKPDLSEMRLVEAFSLDDVRSFPVARFGAKQPSMESVPARRDALDACDIDLLVVPGLAFGPECTRLGHGAGFYDRFIAALRARCAALGRPVPPIVGLALRAQCVGRVPTGPGDVRLDRVLRPTP